MPWIERTLERAEVNPRAHLLLAEVLHRLGWRAQAMLELRTGFEQDEGLADAIGATANAWTQDPQALFGLVPPGVRGVPLLEALAAHTPGDELRERLARDALDREPGAAWAHETLGRALVASARAHACDGERRAACEAEIEAHARAIEEARPGRSDAARLRAAMLVAEGRSEEAAAMLRERCASFEDRARCLETRMLVAASVRDAAALHAAAKEWVGFACADEAACAGACGGAADALAGRGEWATALGYRIRAAETRPTEARWRAVAEAAIRAGAPTRAAEALERAMRLAGARDAETERRIAELRGAALIK